MKKSLLLLVGFSLIGSGKPQPYDPSGNRFAAFVTGYTGRSQFDSSRLIRSRTDNNTPQQTKFIQKCKKINNIDNIPSDFIKAETYQNQYGLTIFKTIYTASKYEAYRKEGLFSSEAVRQHIQQYDDIVGFVLEAKRRGYIDWEIKKELENNEYYKHPSNGYKVLRMFFEDNPSIGDAEETVTAAAASASSVASASAAPAAHTNTVAPATSGTSINTTTTPGAQAAPTNTGTKNLTKNPIVINMLVSRKKRT